MAMDITLLNSSLAASVRKRLSRFLLFGGALGLLACSDTPTAVPYAPEPDLEPEVSLGDPRVAFVSDREGRPYVYVADADGSNVTRLVRGEQPAWSPDGRHIAFVRNGTIHRMTFGGADVRELAEGTEPTWASDGTIAYFLEDRIMAMDALGSSRRTIVHPGFVNHVADDCTALQLLGPTWSSDGVQIAFLGSYSTQQSPGSCYSTVELFVMDVGDKAPRSLSPVADLWVSHGEWLPRSPPLRWSRDGSEIIGSMFDPYAGDESVIVSFNSESGERQTLFRSRGWVGRIDWAGDGRRIVFADFPEGAPQGAGRRIFELLPETGEIRRLIPDVAKPVWSQYGDYDPAWVHLDP